jgi:leader peptidase (prepilin peptidase)/N-methyltransferase
LTDVWIIMAFLAGLCVGSFANVLVYRLPRDQQVVGGRSRCPRCEATIAWFDNVPLLSWIVLGGRCRTCRAPISWRYPTVELTVGLIAVAVVVWLGPTPAALRVFLFLVILLVVTIIDAAFLIIPHSLTIAGLTSGLVLATQGGPGFVGAALGASLGGLIIVGLDRGYRLVRGRAGMGGGDAPLLAMIGAHVGPWGVPATLGIAAVTGATFAIVSARGRIDGQQRLPFGPFLCLGGAVVLLWGERLWSWYLSLFA